MTPPDGDLYFQLDNDIVNFYTYGLGKARWAKGLSKGTYKAIGEDKNGYYFMPIDGTVILFSGAPVLKFEETGILPENMFHPGWGGIWVPKEGIDKKPKVFQLIRKVNKPIDQWQGGAVHMAAADIVDGSMVFVNMKSFPDFTDSIKIEMNYSSSIDQ